MWPVGYRRRSIGFPCPCEANKNLGEVRSGLEDLGSVIEPTSSRHQLNHWSLKESTRPAGQGSREKQHNNGPPGCWSAWLRAITQGCCKCLDKKRKHLLLRVISDCIRALCWHKADDVIERERFGMHETDSGFLCWYRLWGEGGGAGGGGVGVERHNDHIL